MKVYHNGTYVSEEQISLSINNRSFLYGDGFFETMLGFTGRVKLLAFHLKRISEALHTLWIDVPEEFEYENCCQIIARLFEENKIRDFARIKMIAWREEGGTYLPYGKGCNLLITISEISKPLTGFKHKVSFSDRVKNHWSEISKFKSVNAQSYVLAALEMKARQFDEIVITDADDNVSECLVSNIFWVKDRRLYTPSLQTGCIEGVSRMAIIEELAKRNISVHQVNAPKKELLNADSVFCTNAVGISHILKIEGKTYDTYPEIEDIYTSF